MSVNKAILVGRLGKDPELKHTQNGKAHTTLSIATTNYDKSTEWHIVQVWEKTAEFCCKYLTKGRQVYIEGRINTSKWEDKDGAMRYTTKIVAEKVQFLGNRADNEGTSNPPPDNTYTESTPDDDVPF